jgi:hypothetical protein
LTHGFSIEADTSCNIKVKDSQRNVLFEADDHMLNVGYGYVDKEELMVNGNLNEYPRPHIFRNVKMTCKPIESAHTTAVISGQISLKN